MSYQRRFYILTNLDNGTKITLNGKGSNNEPKGWDDSEKTWKRSTKDFSFTFEFSKNLEFTGAGAAFLREAYNSRDVEANVEMTEYRYNPNTDEPYVYSIALFDFSKIDREKTVVKIPFKSGGLKSLLKSKFNDKFELERTEAINGNTLDPLIKQEFAGINRPIYLSSRLESIEEDRNSSYRIEDNGTYNYAMISYPMNVVYSSDTSISGVIPGQASIGSGSVINFDIIGARAGMFYYNNNVDKNISISLENINFNYRYQYSNAFPVVDLIRLGIMRFNGAENPIVTVPTDSNSFIEILDMTSSLSNNVEVNFNTSFQTSINLKAGESLMFGFFVESRMQLGGSGVIDNYITSAQGRNDITEFSVRNDINRRALCLLNKDVGEREMQVITGEKNRYYSEYLTTGEFSKTALTNGKLIRGFNDSKLSVSLKDFIQNCNSLFNMGYNVEIINSKEVLVHEEMKHFFRQEVAIVIPNQVNNVKRTVASEFIYSTIKSGYKKPSGDNLYEEVNGLSEVNTTNSYITNITRVEKEYNIESPYRADSEGKELTFRQSISVNPNGDYRTDNTNFNIDLKDIGTSVLEEKIWSDYYEELPKSNGSNTLISPETMTGIYYTPFRNMQRHFWFLNNALTKFRDKYIRYTDTRGNSEFVTKKEGEEEKAENGKYLVSDIETPRFVSQWIEFEYELDFDLLNAVNGKTNVNGRDIPNTYFRIEFVNEFNEKEFGYLFELKPNKEGKWKVLKAI